MGEHAYPVRVQLDPEVLSSRRALGEVIVAHRPGPIALADVASIQPAFSPTRILRRDRRPMVRVSADLAPGVDLGSAKDQADQVLQALQSVQPIAWSPDGRTVA